VPAPTNDYLLLFLAVLLEAALPDEPIRVEEETAVDFLLYISVVLTLVNFDYDCSPILVLPEADGFLILPF